MKISLYKAIVMSTAICINEMWKDIAPVAQKLNFFHQWSLCKYLVLLTKIKWPMTKLCRAGLCSLHFIVVEHRLWLVSHILCLSIHKQPKTTMQWTPVGGKWKWWRPKVTWHSTFYTDLQWVTIRGVESDSIVASCLQWRQLAAQCAEKHRKK